MIRAPVYWPKDDTVAINVIMGLREFLEWTGRAIRDDKRGFISSDLPPILTRLQISPRHRLKLATELESRFKGIACSAESIKQKCGLFGLTRKKTGAIAKICLPDEFGNGNLTPQSNAPSTFERPLLPTCFSTLVLLATRSPI